MAKVSETVIGQTNSEAIVAVYAHIIKGVRKQGVDHVVTYQHQHAELEKLPFIEVYSYDEEKEKHAATVINWNPAVRPEDFLTQWSVDRVIIQSDQRTPRGEGESLVTYRKVIALVIVRWHGAMNETGVLRYKVELEYSYNWLDRGGLYKNSVEAFNGVDQNDIELTQLINDEALTLEIPPRAKIG